MRASAKHLLYGTSRRAYLSLVVLVLFGYLSVYAASFAMGRPAQSNQTHHTYLADAFLHGRLDVDPDATKGLVELVPFHDKLYVVFPPLPAVLMLPVVALFGPHILTGLISILFVALGIAFVFRWLRCLEIEVETAWWVAFLFAFGAGLWYTGLKGSSWNIAHAMAIAFLTMALVEASTRKRGLVAGLLLGAAFLCRLPILLCFPFVGWLLVQKTDRRVAKVAAFLVAVGACYACNMLYNWLRFHSVSNVAYTMIPGVLDEPWYDKGIFDPSYLPRNIFAIVFQPPVLVGHFPYFIPSAFGLSMFFASPALLLMFLAPNTRTTWFLVLATGACLLPAVFHGYPGPTQFGYRYSLDALPFLAGLTALGIRHGVTARVLTLIGLSCMIGAWGIAYLQILPVQWLYPVFVNVH